MVPLLQQLPPGLEAPAQQVGQEKGPEGDG